jgi:hypothetical protein
MARSSSATLTRKPLAMPVAVDCRARREPLASVTTLALTPASRGVDLVADAGERVLGGADRNRDVATSPPWP